MKRLAIIGSGDLGQQIAYHAKNDNHFQPVGFFDDFQQAGSPRHGLPVLGGVNDVLKSFEKKEFDQLMIGIGYKHMKFRTELYNRFCDVVPLASIVHSSSYVDKSCTVGAGVMIYPGCVIDMSSVIEDNVLLNAGCVIAHDTMIGKNCFLSPGVKLAGFVHIAPETILGIGTIVIDNIKISENVRTGAGAVVISNLESPGLYVGVPATLKKNF